MKISVIIPTYKPQAYLWECLDSLCRQTYPHADYEVILVLNGCNEPFSTQIEEYIRQHQDIQWNYIQIDQGGVSNARNLAIDAAQGEYITFIDDDDYVSNTFLESLIKVSDIHTIALSDVYAFIEGSHKRLQYRISDVYQRKCKEGVLHFTNVWKYFAGPCYKLIPVSLISNRRFDTSFSIGEDTLFMFLISDRITKISFANSDAIYYRRIRKGSAMTKSRNRMSIVHNELRLLLKISQIYFKSIPKYNFRFYTINILSIIHGLIKAI